MIFIVIVIVMMMIIIIEHLSIYIYLNYIGYCLLS